MKKNFGENTDELAISKSFYKSNIKSLRKRDIAILIVVQMLMLTAIYALNDFRPAFDQVHFERMETVYGQILVYTLTSILIYQSLFLIYLVYLFIKYKPIKSVPDDQLLSCTVIVPAYNEGELVYHTIKSIVVSDYPREKLQIIAVDDGSKDDTWEWIKKAKNELGDSITIFKQDENKGKRHALLRGFNEGKGDIFITIDSDSMVFKDTLRNMVSPFVVNKNCGGVAGNVQVLNKNQGIIPRMLNVSFVFSFEFIRSAQSSLGFVLCTPGALAAYRREAITNCLEEWVNQKFMGCESSIGEDRAITNLILEQGYDVQFQKNANVLTNTPTGYKTLHKMFTRWGRSNVRETLKMLRFIFKDFRKVNKLGARLICINEWIKLVLVYPFLILMICFLIMHPLLYITSALVGAFLFSTFQMLFYTKRYNFIESLWAYPYSVFYMFGLFWIYPFSIVTVKNGGWLTR